MAQTLVTLAEIAHVVDRPRSVVDNWSMDRLRNAPPFPQVAKRDGRLKRYAWTEVRTWLKATDQPVVNKLP